MHSISWLSRGLLVAGALASVAALAQQPQRGGILNYGILAEPSTYDCHAAVTFAVIQQVAPHDFTLLQYEQNKYPNIIGTGPFKFVEHMARSHRTDIGGEAASRLANRVLNIESAASLEEVMALSIAS